MGGNGSTVVVVVVAVELAVAAVAGTAVVDGMNGGDVDVVDVRGTEAGRSLIVGGTMVVVVVGISADVGGAVVSGGAVVDAEVDGDSVGGGTVVVVVLVVVVVVVVVVVEEVVVVEDVVDDDGEVVAGEMSVETTDMLKYVPAQFPDVTSAHVEPLSPLVLRTKDATEPAGVGAVPWHFQLTVPVLWKTTKYWVADVPRSMSVVAVNVKSPSPHGSTDCPLMRVEIC